MPFRASKNSNIYPSTLINAVEAYTVIEFSELETSVADVAAIKNIKATYHLKLARRSMSPSRVIMGKSKMHLRRFIHSTNNNFLKFVRKWINWEHSSSFA